MRVLFSPTRVLVCLVAGLLLCASSAHAFESVDIEVTPIAHDADNTTSESAPDHGTAPTPGADAEPVATAETPAEEAPPPGPTIMFRGEVTDGAMTPTFSLFSKEVILWALYPNTQYSDYEIGRTVWEKKTKKGYYSLVGYAAVWPHQHQYFALPWFYSTIADGKNTYTINLAEYIPLNDGPWTFVADGNSVMRRISKETSVGFDSLYYDQEGLPKLAQWGPAINLASAKDHVSLYARALIFGQGEDTYRVDLYFH